MSTLVREPESSLHTPFVDATGAPDGMAARFTSPGAFLSGQGVSLVEVREELARNDALLAMVAHELRSPLNAMRLSTEIMQGPSFSRQDIERSVKTIDRQIAHLSQLADDLLDATRVSHGVLRLHKIETNFDTILGDSLERVGLAVENRAQTLSVVVPDKNVLIDGDPVRLAQAIGNLLTNTIKYTPVAGEIKLGVRVKRNELVVSVTDNGQGISSSLLPHVFDLFAQSRRTIASSAGGLGIGLAIVKLVAQLHGGTVTASSAGPGTGSEFVLRLPIVVVRATKSRRG